MQTKENGASAHTATKLINFEQGYIPIEIIGQWIVDSTRPKDEGYSIHSPETADSASSYFEITEKNVGRVSFDYYVSAESFDVLRFLVNEKIRGTFKNSTVWKHVDILLRPGNYVFRWSYDKDRSTHLREDKVWVDNIEFLFVLLEQ